MPAASRDIRFVGDDVRLEKLAAEFQDGMSAA